MADFKLDSEYVLDKNNFTMSYPVGSIVAIAKTGIPSGWLLCNGQSVLTADYPDLAQVFGVVGSSFLVPDLNNKMLSGILSTGNAVTTSHNHTIANPGATVSTTAIANHTHSSSGTHTAGSMPSHEHSANNASGHSLGNNNSNISNRATGNTTFIAGTTHNHNYAEFNAFGSNDGGHSHNHGNKSVPVNASYSHNHSTVTQSTSIVSQSTLFPSSVFFYYIIKT